MGRRQSPVSGPFRGPIQATHLQRRFEQQYWERIVLDQWVPYRSEDATIQLRIFGFPHAAGNALSYRSWRKHMPPEIDFCPVELPGHGQRFDEMPFTDLGALTTALQVVLRPLMTVPFAFFGHSTGACVAFEAARVLHAADGRSATHLFVSGRAAPGYAIGARPIRSLSDQELAAALIGYGGTPAAVIDRKELMAALVSTLRADLELVESLRLAAGIRLSCPIIVFGGADDTIDSASLQAWNEFTATTFRVRMFPGGHFYFSGTCETLIDEIVDEVRRSGTLFSLRLAGAVA